MFLTLVGILQIGVFFFIVSVFVRGFPLWFGDPLVHPDDDAAPYNMQRIQVQDTGDDAKDFIQRRYVRAGMFYPIAAGLVWLCLYRYFGLLIP